jgi:hypothetical protein
MVDESRLLELEDMSVRARCAMFRDMKKDILNTQDRIFKRLDEIEKLINSHAIGVQNVYEKFNKLFELMESKKEIDEGFRLEMAEFVRKIKR